MNDQQETAPNEPVLAEGSTVRPNETADRVLSSETPPAPVPTLLMMSGDDAGRCTGDACAIPVPPRKVQ